MKRYDCTNGRAQLCYGCYQMTETEHGAWVLDIDYDAAQSELAALREELQRITCAYRTELDELAARNYDMRFKLAAAEQRNAELVELLKTVPFGLHTGSMFIDGECKCRQCEFVRAVGIAIKPTESGASE